MKILKKILICLFAFVLVVCTTVFFIYSGFGERPETINAIAHRGYSIAAPENTLPAYKLAKEKGFNYAECDVAFTKDGVAVLLHDSTIDRTSDGEGKLSDLTYEEVLQYDFGSWFSSEYEGLKIPTFEQFIDTCKEIGLHPYIELKSSDNYTQEQITSLVTMVEEKGMIDNVTWISFNIVFLSYVKEADDEARLGYLSTKFNDQVLEKALLLRTDKNEVFLDLNYFYTTTSVVNRCKKENMPIEIWTVNKPIIMYVMNPYISGVTSDVLIADEVL